MPVHDWTLVPAGIFHAFHVDWIPEIQKVLNRGLLPPGYYALPEQHAGRSIADILTLHSSEPPPEPLPPAPATGGLLLAEAPPKVQRKKTIAQEMQTRRRSLAIRHISGHRLVALLEILSPANKDRTQSVAEFAAKIASALRVGVHVMVVDLFPPGHHDPHGIQGAIQEQLNSFEESEDLPEDEPLTVLSYIAGPRIDVYFEHLAVGAALPEMPLFLRPDRYVNVPLESTYQEAYSGMPSFWKDVLERPSGDSAS